MDICDEVVTLVEHLQENGKSLEEIYNFSKSLYEYVSILYDDGYSSEEKESTTEEEYDTIEETYEIQTDKEGFMSLK